MFSYLDFSCLSQLRCHSLETLIPRAETNGEKREKNIAELQLEGSWKRLGRKKAVVWNSTVLKFEHVTLQSN